MAYEIRQRGQMTNVLGEIVKLQPPRMPMVKPSKALRGKHRWVGIKVNQNELNRKACHKLLENILDEIKFRMYDCIIEKKSALVIIKVALIDLKKTRVLIENSSTTEPLTTSGKIRLVRERLGVSKPSKMK